MRSSTPSTCEVVNKWGSFWTWWKLSRAGRLPKNRAPSPTSRRRTPSCLRTLLRHNGRKWICMLISFHSIRNSMTCHRIRKSSRFISTSSSAHQICGRSVGPLCSASAKVGMLHHPSHSSLITQRKPSSNHKKYAKSASSSHHIIISLFFLLTTST